ncbi:ARM repeat-containing protein [Xylaria nigripes]|nr:ARM repeat-containing protein [Xylaria nigripes]
MTGTENNNTQHLGRFGGSAWDRNAIWGSVGATYNTYNRNTTASAGSDDLSPTAPPGPSQLNSGPEPASWGSRIWTPTLPNANNVSPTRPGGDLLYQSNENGHNTPTYPLRQSISQGKPGLQNRTVPPGPVESSGFPCHYNRTAIGGMVGEDRGSSTMFIAPGASHLTVDAAGSHRRNSADPSSLCVSQNRPGTYNGRQSETIAPSLASPFGETMPYPFSNGAHARPHTQRPSIAAASPSSPAEATRSNGLKYAKANIDISELSRRLTIQDTTEGLSGYVSNGHMSLAQPSLSNPNSQTWQDEITNGTRSFSHGTPQDTWSENPQQYYPSAPRASIERNSPASGSYRQHISSPRNLSGIPSSRADPWSRTLPRNPSMLHDLDRQQQNSQYPQQPTGNFAPYFTPSVSQFPTYDQFQLQNYRPQIPETSYTMQLNFAESPARAARNRDPVQGARSKLLEEFRNRHKTGRQFELKDIYRHVVEFSGDQHGSRFIQDKLEGANSEEKEHLFEEILPNAIQLMKDVFGNYVIQKFFDYGSQVQKKLLARQMEGQVADLSIQMYSCRVVQKALEHVLVEQQERIVEELNLRIMQVAMDQNGNHVVQKVIHMFPRRCIPVALEAFRGQIETLAVHGYVCRVIQRILENCEPSERESLMAEIHPCAAKLMTDQYGNYVIQHVIHHGQLEDRRIMIQHVINQAVVLSKHKYASNIVEKCVQYGEIEDQKAILARLRTPGSDGASPLPLMMKDQFGNYVVQRLIEYLEVDDKRAFLAEVKTYIPLLKRQCTGRQNTALDRLTTAADNATKALAEASGSTGDVDQPTSATNNATNAVATSSGNTGDVAAGGSAPSSPGLAAEVSSASPTPLLSTEQNSPQSSSPSSTNISTTGDCSEETERGQASRPTKTSSSVPVSG